MVHIRAVTAADAQTWLYLRQALWPDTTERQHQSEIAEFYADQGRAPATVLLAEDQQRQVVGFAELSIRPYAEGCETQRVAYLEGWYVVPEYRAQGFGKALVEAAAAWGRSQGCTEFASDAEADNIISQQAHLALDFQEVGLVRCFRKTL